LPPGIPAFLPKQVREPMPSGPWSEAPPQHQMQEAPPPMQPMQPMPPMPSMQASLMTPPKARGVSWPVIAIVALLSILLAVGGTVAATRFLRKR
jgi:hypothetical protein